MNKERMIISIVSALGMLATFMPWINAPIVGSINGSQGDGWITFIIFAIPLLISLRGDTTKKIENRYFVEFGVSVPCVLAGLFGIWKIVNINSIMSNLSGNPFANSLSMSVSIGFGLYVVVIAGFALPVYLTTTGKN